MRENVVKQGIPISQDNWGPGYRLFQSIKDMLSQRGPEGATPVLRVGSHLVILLVALAVLMVSRLQLPTLDIVEAPPDSVEEVIDQEYGLAPELAAEVTTAEVYGLTRAAVPITMIPERARTNVITHTVVPGDTLYGISQKYKLSAETIMFSNGLEKNPDLLSLGQKLAILPINGILHTVGKNDTLDKIAKTYKVTTEAIVTYPLNRLDPQAPQIVAGQKIIVPGAKKEIPQIATVYRGTAPAGAKVGSGRLIWPTSGSLTQGYKPYHRALDLARAVGTPIKAADNGYVVVAGWSNAGYGNYVVIDHGNGLQTLYGHLSRIFVRPGNVVTKGAVIGNMGNTGNSTGPHLHFEVIKRGVKVNPSSLLP
jgi:murein DD-endopeptidase MepM/ murein hydrolase activator NlpD